MGYILPVTVPAWKVTIYGRSLLPNWVRSPSHPVRTFRSLRDAKSHIAYVQARSKWSLIWVEYRGEIERVARTPDFWDKLRAFINQRPFCGSLGELYDTRPLP